MRFIKHLRYYWDVHSVWHVFLTAGATAALFTIWEILGKIYGKKWLTATVFDKNRFCIGGRLWKCIFFKYVEGVPRIRWFCIRWFCSSWGLILVLISIAFYKLIRTLGKPTLMTSQGSDRETTIFKLNNSNTITPGMRQLNGLVLICTRNIR